MYDGVLNIYKEKGYTSHDVVAKLRGILGQKRIGHTGTLDPEAEGVLPVCLGRATRLCDMMAEETKTYEAVLRLGIETDTQDMTGTVLREADPKIGGEALRELIAGFKGDGWQVPPMYSALKVNGRKLYELAREGRTVERKARPVTIHEISVRDIRMPLAYLSVTCSKGTYIRTLCHDIGQKAGCGGCMESLKRTRVGRFLERDSLKLSDIEALRDTGGLEGALMTVEAFFADLRAVRTLPEWDKLPHNGNPCPPSCAGCAAPAPGERVRFYDSAGMFAGVYEYLPEKGVYQPRKMFL